MYFKTQSHWQDKNPAPKNSGFRWRAVELILGIYYYHVRFEPDAADLGLVGTDILLGDLEDVLGILLEYPNSTLFLQTPAWLNNGEPGLYRVVCIYKSTDGQMHIAECADGTLRTIGDMSIDKKSKKLATVKKVPIWRSR